MSCGNTVGSKPQACLGPHYSFLGLPASENCSFEESRAVIIPVSYDGTTTFRSGTRGGPRAILDASRELELFDEETCTEPFREGIFTLDEVPVTVSSPVDMVERVRETGEFVLNAGKVPVMLGGEHLLSLGMIEALSKRYGNLSILHLDAHADLKDEYQGSAYSNACVMRRAFNMGKLVQVGIRSLTREEYDFIQEQGIPCFFSYRLRENPELWGDILSQLGANVYVSIDLDVFDPSLMPSVGTPEPGGVGWDDVLSLLKSVALKRNIVGFDIMELMPIPQLVAPDFFAARLVYKLLAYIFMDNQAATC